MGSSGPESGGGGAGAGPGVRERTGAEAAASGRVGADADAVAGSDAAERLQRLRDEVLDCNTELVAVLRRRRDLVYEIGRLKKEMGLPVTHPQREAAVVRSAASMARAAGVDSELIRDLIWMIISAARKQQLAPPRESGG